MVVEQMPSGRAIRASAAEVFSHIAKDRSLVPRHRTDGLLGLGNGSPRHRIQIAGLQKGRTRFVRLPDPGQSLPQ